MLQPVNQQLGPIVTNLIGRLVHRGDLWAKDFCERQVIKRCHSNIFRTLQGKFIKGMNETDGH